MSPQGTGNQNHNRSPHRTELPRIPAPTSNFITRPNNQLHQSPEVFFPWNLPQSCS